MLYAHVGVNNVRACAVQWDRVLVVRTNVCSVR